MADSQFTARPSAAGMWVRCGGYVSMSTCHPELPGDNEVREEGIGAHWLAYETGNGRPQPNGVLTPNGVEIDDEMQNAVREYLAVLRGWGVQVYLEHTVAIPSIHPQCGGTIDAWGWDPINRILYVGDLKYGYNPVDPFENWQLLCYVRGALDFLQALHGQFTEHFKVRMYIVQPRGYGHDVVKVWRTTSDNLYGYMHTLKQAAKVAIEGTGELTAGDHCYYCSARNNCPALQKAALQLIDVSTDQHSLELTNDQAAAELRRIDRAINVLKSRQSGLESQLEHAIGEGYMHPNFERSGGKGKLDWREGVHAQVAALASLLGKDLKKPMALITPTQAKGLLSDELLANYTQHKPGKLKLRRLADNHADKMFNQE